MLVIWESEIRERIKNDQMTNYEHGNFIPFLFMITALLGFFCAIAPDTITAATYYVDASHGDDSGAGTTEKTPWKTLNKINNANFLPGDKILLKRGEIWHQWIWFKSSGAPGNPIIIGAYGDPDDPRPILDGTNPAPIIWKQSGPHIYQTVAHIWDKPPGILIYRNNPSPAIATLQFRSAVNRVKTGAVLIQTRNGYCNFRVTSVDIVNKRISGVTFFRNPGHWSVDAPVEVRQTENAKYVKFKLSLSRHGLVSMPQSLTLPGHWCWDKQKHSVYLHSRLNPADFSVKIAQFKWGFVALNQKHLIIKDLAIRGYSEIGINLFKCQHIHVKNTHISHIGANGAKTGILLNNSSNCTINSNGIESVLVTGIGIYAYNNSDSPGEEACCNKIIDNTILYPGSAGISLATDSRWQARMVHDNIIKGNTVDHANMLAYDAGGIYSLFVGSKNVIQGNIVRNGGSEYLQSSGIMADSGSAPINIIDNLVENNSFGGIVVTGKGHNISHNRVKNNGYGSWQSAQLVFFTVTDNASACTVQYNTIEAGNSQKLLMVINGKPVIGHYNHSFDYNRYLSKETDGFCWQNGWRCDRWININRWRQKTGQDRHSTFSLLAADIK